MTARPNAKVAADVWHLIRCLADPEVGTSMVLKRDDDFHAAAQNLIEMACDSAVQARVQELEREVAACKAANRIALEGATDENVDAYLAIVADDTSAWEPPVTVPATHNSLSRFAAQIVHEPNRLCSTCQHPAKNHTLGRCRKKRCGCGGWGAEKIDRLVTEQAGDPSQWEAPVTVPKVEADDLRPEYDLSTLSGGVRGKYASRAELQARVQMLENDCAVHPNTPASTACAFCLTAALDRVQALEDHLRVTREHWDRDLARLVEADEKVQELEAENALLTLNGSVLERTVQTLAADLKRSGDVIDTINEQWAAAQQGVQELERRIEAVIYAYEGRDVPEDQRDKSFVKRAVAFRAELEREGARLQELVDAVGPEVAKVALRLHQRLAKDHTCSSCGQTFTPEEWMQHKACPGPPKAT